MEDYEQYMDERGHEACAQMLARNSARERRELLDEVAWLNAELHGAEIEAKKLRGLIRDVVLLAVLNGCDVTNMQMHVKGGDWRTVWERMEELGVEE